MINFINILLNPLVGLIAGVGYGLYLILRGLFEIVGLVLLFSANVLKTLALHIAGLFLSAFYCLLKPLPNPIELLKGVGVFIIFSAGRLILGAVAIMIVSAYETATHIIKTALLGFSLALVVPFIGFVAGCVNSVRVIFLNKVEGFLMSFGYRHDDRPKLDFSYSLIPVKKTTEFGINRFPLSRALQNNTSSFLMSKHSPLFEKTNILSADLSDSFKRIGSDKMSETEAKMIALSDKGDAFLVNLMKPQTSSTQTSISSAAWYRQFSTGGDSASGKMQAIQQRPLVSSIFQQRGSSTQENLAATTSNLNTKSRYGR